MPTEIDLANKALYRLGAEALTSTDGTIANIVEDNLQSKVVKNSYQIIRDAVLEDRAWTFAMNRVQLNADPTPPAFGYDQRFPIPSDVVNVFRVDDGSETYMTQWVREGQYVFANDTDVLNIEYISRITDPNLYSNMFVECLSIRLAHEWCIPITENVGLANSLVQEYQARLIDASASDSAQARREIFRSSQMIDVRGGIGRRPTNVG